MSNAVKSASKAFYEFPARKSQFLQEVQTSKSLHRLWADSNISNYENMNSIATTPPHIQSKEDIYEEIQYANPTSSSFALKTKQMYGFAKSLATFYKEGIVRVQQGRRIRNSILMRMKLTNQVDSRGNGISIGVRNFGKLTREMSQALFIVQVQDDNQSKEFVKRESEEDKEPLFNLKRSEYQVLKRAPSNTLKIPLFGLLALIFMESTPILCYFVPEITPSTCVLPSILPSLWNVSASKQLENIRTVKYSTSQCVDLSYKNAFNLPLDEAKALAKSLRLVSRVVPSALMPELVVRRRLQNYYNYLLVDNHYLSGDNGDGNMWDLGNEELVNAALERNLILDLKSDLKYISEGKSTEERKSRREAFYRNLQLRLFIFLVDFKQYNVGYLGVNHILNQPIDDSIITVWRAK